MIKNRQIGSGGFGTHITPLVTAVMATDGDILEFGAGDYSTPLLHTIIDFLICSGREGKIWSFDSDKNWVNNFKDLDNSEWHYVEHIPDWDYVAVQECAVAFIDHAPAERRVIDIERFKNHAQIIVVHDTEKSNYYGYEPVLSSFKYRFDYERYSKKTTLVSNFIDVTKIL